MVFTEGLSAISARMKGAGVGVVRTGIRDGRFSIGGGAYRGRFLGVKQTMLSRIATPPKMRNGLISLLGMSCALSILYSGNLLREDNYSGAAIAFLIGSTLMFATCALYRRRRGIYDAAIAVYESTRVCRRCGTFYTTGSLSAFDLTQQSSPDSASMGLIVCSILSLTFAIALFYYRSAAPADTAAQPAAPIVEAANPFEWPTVGLPKDIARALKTTSIAPWPGSSEAIALGTSGEKQEISTDAETADEGSGGPHWHVRDPSTQTELLEGQGALHKTRIVANGYYELLIEEKWVLALYEFDEDRYVITSCYLRTGELGSPGKLAPCP